MSKFSIENILIEKSNKDIQTGVVREFTEGINLICGNNEAGKSTLLKFIRQGFFKVKGVDKGKIYFKITDENGIKHYRTDIQDNRSSDLRCKIYDENNNPVNSGFIENTVNKKYFEQGFTIDLDDLMNIQNKDTDILVNTIKDPSGEKLSYLLDKIRNEAKKILGDNNRLTKETTGLLEQINKENIKINELSNLEADYNETIEKIKEINNELECICKQEEYISVLEKLEDLNSKLNDVKEQHDIIVLRFNEKLLNNQEKYTKIIQDAGRIDANKEIIQKNSAKIEQLNTKIYSEMNRLRSEFSLDPQQKDIENFTIDYSILRQLKTISEKKNQLEKEFISIKQNRDNLEENILKLKHEKLPLETEIPKDDEITNLKELYDFVNENLIKLNYLIAKKNDDEKTKKINSQGIFSGRNLIILLFILFAAVSTVSYLCFYNHIKTTGIFCAITAVFLLIGIILIWFSKWKSSIDKEIEQTAALIENTDNQLKDKLKTYYKDIDNVENSYLPLKIENLKNEIQNKLQNYMRIKELLTKNSSDYAYNNEKLEAVKNKAEQIQAEIKQIDEGAIALIKSAGNQFEIPLDIYTSSVEIIKKLKEYITEKNVIANDSIELQNENIKITDKFNDFIKEMQLTLNFSENHTENIQRLKSYNEANTSLKNNIDVLNVQIENVNKQIKLLEEKKSDYSEFEGNIILKDELQNLKSEKINQKKEAEFKKRELEAFEGLNELKIKKSVLLEEYRKKICTLAKDKMILEIIKTAKDGFDKIQPDLQNAQKYLEILTDGKYSKINLDLEEIQSADGSLTKKWNDLSRGTKEQVYFALRLGYASNYTKDRLTLEANGKADLPLIIDDAFVNFDALRTRQGIKCLIEFSKTNQVLFFTCHSETMTEHFKELCDSAGIEINIINI